ncbi:hypothetical protein FSARC_11559 [Fusarium sarcochroum]|uniref:Uncharacterized protein n=1 Tax=Fusarium sarcochroum TaxID=1208366 RepID=A0A8H4TEJ7_9HYPO|nr:hypothetical protein FSARC_11559 [Fusarium sarcochroum]
MDSFNDQEKRHLLAEIIKNSQLDTKTLEMFVKSNCIEPNWMQMQLPAGRNMAQCIQAAYSLEIQQRGTKRKASFTEPENRSSNDAQSFSSQELPTIPRTPTSSESLAILPRPPAMPLDSRSQHPQPNGPPPKKKKGRPAYAGREVTSHRPFNPRPIAPRPPPQLQPEPQSSFRPIAPAPHPVLPPLPASGPLQSISRGPNRTLPPAQQPVTGSRHSNPLGIGPMVLRRMTRRQPQGIRETRQTERVPHRPRSLSEAVIDEVKKEPTQNDGQSSIRPSIMDNYTTAGSSAPAQARQARATST